MKIKINGQYITFFDEVAYSLSLDTVASAFSFMSRHNPENILHKDIFRPLSYPSVQIFNDKDQLLLTGTITNHNFKSNSQPSLWQLSGYSKPGILENSNIEIKNYPLEFNKSSLKDIAERVLKPFKIGLVIDPIVSEDSSVIFDNTVIDPSESIKDFLAKLAAQRNIVLSHDENGNLILTRPNATAPPKYRFNKENTVFMGANIRGENLHSQISVIKQINEDNEEEPWYDTLKNQVSEFFGFSDEEGETQQYAIINRNNTFVKKYSPKVTILSSGTKTPSDTMRAVKNQLASEYKNIEFSISLDRVLDLLPGDIVEVQNDEIFLSEYTRLMVNNVTLKETTAESNMTINLLLPESFTGEVPKDIFK